MAKQKNLPPQLQAWVEARERFHLSHAHVQMARELGMNPKKLGGKANHKQERWKVPLPQYIEELYFKRFKRERPDSVRPIEQMAAERERKKAERRERKQQRHKATPQEIAIQPPAPLDPQEATDDEIPF